MSFPPTNHFAKGGFQSSTFLQGLNQATFSFAIFAQNRCGLAAPCRRCSAAVLRFQFAVFAMAGSGWKTRVSFSSDSMSGMGVSLGAAPQR